MLFLLPLLMLLLVGEWFVRLYPNSYRYKTEWMDAHADSVRVLMLGASHVYYGIVPGQLAANSFSMANVAQPYECDWFLLDKYADRLTHLTDVVLSVDDSSPFDLPLEQLPNDWHRCIYYRLYMDYGKHSQWSKYGFELASLSSYRRKIASALEWVVTGEPHLDCDSLGAYAPSETTEEFDSLYMLNRSKVILERHRCKDWSQVDKNCAYLYRIADWCKQHRVRLHLVTMPLWRGYYDKIDPKQRERMHQIARHCVEQYGATYHDYMRDTRFWGEDFQDCDHLSPQGARKFTRILREDILREADSGIGLVSQPSDHPSATSRQDQSDGQIEQQTQYGADGA